MKSSCQFISSVSAMLPTKHGTHLSLLVSKYDLHKLGSFCGLTLGVSYRLLAVMRKLVSQVSVCFFSHFKEHYDKGALCIVIFGSAVQILCFIEMFEASQLCCVDCFDIIL